MIKIFFFKATTTMFLKKIFKLNTENQKLYNCLNKNVLQLKNIVHEQTNDQETNLYKITLCFDYSILRNLNLIFELNRYSCFASFLI